MEVTYYNLYHVYEKDTDDIVKFIGLFDSTEEIEKVIECLMTKSGFRDFPRDCFEIHECHINLSGWSTGFSTVYY